MARQFGGASTDIVQSVLTNEPAQASYFIWIYRIGNGGSSAGRAFNKGDSGGGSSSINFNNNNTDNTYDFGHQFSTTNGTWRVPRPNTNEWHNFFIGYDNGATTNDPIIDQDGTPQTVTEASTPAGTFTATETQKYNIGNRGNDSARVWDGYLAEFAIWNRILSAGERAALGKGFSPLCMPNGLVEYIPLVRDIISRKLAAPSSSGTSVIQHPRIIYSFGPSIFPSDIVTAGSPPAAPSNLILVGVSHSQVDLTWTDNSSDETSFRIERKTGAGGTYSEIDSNAANDVTYSDTTVAPSTTYFYRVRARNASGDSSYLTEQSITTAAAPISSSLLERLQSNVTFICPIWKIISRDGLVAAYAQHTRQLVFNGVTYAVSSVEVMKPLQRLGFGLNSVEVMGVFDEIVTRRDLELGRWSRATIVFEYVDYLNLSEGSTGKIAGVLGKVEILNSAAYKMEMLSKSEALQPLLGELTSPTDRNSFPAGVNPSAFTSNRTVTAVADRRNFTVDGTIQPNNYFRYGLAVFLTRGLTWVDLVNVTLNADNQLEKTSGGTAYNAGAASAEFISAGQFAQCLLSAPSDNLYRTFGLSSLNRDATQATIEFGVEFGRTAGVRSAQVIELGTLKGSAFSFTDTDYIRIKYDADNKIRYYLVSSAGVETLKYTSLVTPSKSLIVDISLFATTTTLDRAKLGIDSGFQSMEVKSNSGNAMEIQLPTPWAVTKYDQIRLVAGYDGTREQARDKFDDMIDSNSEPDLPGLKKILTYPE